jgi:hypothetical protein
MTDFVSGNEKLRMDFEALGLFPGATIQIHAIVDDSQFHHWVKLIGYYIDSVTQN